MQGSGSIGTFAGMGSRLEFVSPAERLRLQKGFTQGEASRLSGVDQRTLRYLEQGERSPRMPVVLKLAKLYDVDPAELLNDIRAFHGERKRAA